jgi:hypothetical protein
MSKYRNKTSLSGLEVVLSGFLFGLVLSYFYSERQRVLEEQLSEIKKRINNGFNTDRQNLESDWRIISSDLRKSYNIVADEHSS